MNTLVNIMKEPSLSTSHNLFLMECTYGSQMCLDNHERQEKHFTKSEIPSCSVSENRNTMQRRAVAGQRRGINIAESGQAI